MSAAATAAPAATAALAACRRSAAAAVAAAPARASLRRRLVLALPAVVLLPLPLPPPGGSGGAAGRRRPVAAHGMAASAEALDVLVKAAVGEPERLGDCPFSQRVLLTLEEKHLPYKHKLVDTSDKPQWFLEANPEGKVPVIKHEGKWVADSDVIAEILDKMTPDPPLGVTMEEKSIGSALFGSFVKYLKSKDPSDGTREALEVELKKLEDQLTKSGGPFILGDRLSSLDLSLAPKLYHVEIALRHFKDWSMPPDLTALRSHIETVQARESFKKTQAPEELVIRGWAAHDGVSK